MSYAPILPIVRLHLKKKKKKKKEERRRERKEGRRSEEEEGGVERRVKDRVKDKGKGG